MSLQSVSVSGVGLELYRWAAGRDVRSPGNAIIGAVSLSASSRRPPLLKYRPTVKYNTRENKKSCNMYLDSATCWRGSVSQVQSCSRSVCVSTWPINSTQRKHCWAAEVWRLPKLAGCQTCRSRNPVHPYCQYHCWYPMLVSIGNTGTVRTLFVYHTQSQGQIGAY